MWRVGDKRRKTANRKIGRMTGKQHLDQILTSCQTISAVTFSGFLFLHLAAPLSAIPYGEHAASSTMHIARELYQTRAGEALVYASVGVHVASGILRRLLRKTRTFTWHHLAGYALIPIVSFHVWNHRLLPARLGLSPEFLNYSFVSYSLHQKPLLSWLSYGALIAISSYHLVAGIRSLWTGRRKQASLKQVKWQGAAAGLACTLGLGLARLAAEPPLPLWLAKRYATI